jgi:molybdopterin-guanine dinucleotide biosynthesis protein A
MSGPVAPTMRTIGAILVGGRSRRFGSPKPLAEVGGRTIIERLLAAHGAVFPQVVLVTDRPAEFTRFGAPIIPDEFAGAGPLGGLHAALGWAERHGAGGVCLSPGDAPFVHPGVLRLLAGEGSASTAAVLPASDGPLGFEPLHGWYSVRTRPLLAAAIASGVLALHRVIGSLDAIRIVPAAEVRRYGDPETLFLNVNTTGDLERARRALAGGVAVQEP